MFKNNAAGSDGGAIWNNATLNINSGTEFVSNKVLATSSDLHGGALYNSGIIVINGSANSLVRFLGNYTSTSSANNNGGAIYNVGTSTSNSIAYADFEYNGYSDYDVNNVAGIDSVSTSLGGAIANNASAYMAISNSTFKNNASLYLGGAIFNAGTMVINSGTNFIKNNVINATAVYGGAIYNGSNGLLTINGSAQSPVRFLGNYTSTTNNVNVGGAIYNIGTSASNSISYADFEYNGYNGYVEGATTQTGLTVSTKDGGAIYNDTGAKLTVANSIFKNNVASAKGGAVLNNNGTFTINSGTEFNQNKVLASTTDVYGGAIYNNSTLNINSGVSFVNNSAISTSGITRGGALLNSGSGVLNIIGTASNPVIFSGNYTSTSNAFSFGGAIYNTGTNTSNLISNAVFEYNGYSDYNANDLANVDQVSTKQGGAIYNDQGYLTIVNSIFSNNAANGSGGAIMNNRGTINIQSTSNGFTLFSGNKSAGVSNAINLYYESGVAATLNLNAGSGGTIAFDDRISSNNINNIININSSSVASSLTKGTVIFNDLVSDSSINLYDGILSLGKDGNSLTNTYFSNVNLALTGGVLDLANNNTDVITLNSLNVASGSTASLSIDANLSTGARDTIVTSNVAGTGSLGLYSVNVKQEGAVSNLKIFTSSYPTLSSVVATTLTNNYKYEFSQDGAGGYNVTATALAIADSGLHTAIESALVVKTFSAVADTSAKYTLGQIVTANAVLTINGNGYSINGAGCGGISIDGGQTLNINSVGSLNADGTVNKSWNGFTTADSGAAIKANYNASLNINSSVFANNSTTYDSAGQGGGVIYNASSANTKISASTFYNNTAPRGGFILNNGNLLINNGSQFIKNSAVAVSTGVSGGVIYNYLSGVFTISGTSSNYIKFLGNYTSTTGTGQAAVIANASTNNLNSINYADFEYNGYSDYSVVNKTASAIATNIGAVIYNSSSSYVTISNSIFKNNAVNTQGGAIYNAGTLKINSGTSFVKNNVTSVSSSIQGGAIYNTSGLISINGSSSSLVKFLGNYTSTSSATSYGGAIYNNSSNTSNLISYADFEYNGYSGYVDGTSNQTGLTALTKGGGAICNGTGGYLAIINSALKNNIATAMGGAIYNNGSLSINSDTLFVNNSVTSASSSAYGGSINNDTSGILTITGVSSSPVKFLGNYTSTSSTVSYGGAIYNNSASASNSISYADFEYNGYSDYNPDNTNYVPTAITTKYGGAIYNNAKINIANTIFRNNSSSIQGGAIYNQVSSVLNINSGTSFIKNSALGTGDVRGGAIFNSGTLTILGSSGNLVNFIGNYANLGGTNHGGAITNTSTTDNSISYANFEYNGYSNYNEISNTASSGVVRMGGAIANTGKLAIFDSIFKNNIANTGGGAIYNQGTLNISSTQFIQNASDSTSVKGGAIHNDNTGVLTITGSASNLVKFLGNYTKSSDTTSYGGAIYNIGTSASNSISYADFEYNGYSDYNASDLASVDQVSTNSG